MNPNSSIASVPEVGDTRRVPKTSGKGFATRKARDRQIGRQCGENGRIPSQDHNKRRTRKGNLPQKGAKNFNVVQAAVSKQLKNTAFSRGALEKDGENVLISKDKRCRVHGKTILFRSQQTELSHTERIFEKRLFSWKPGKFRLGLQADRELVEDGDEHCAGVGTDFTFPNFDEFVRHQSLETSLYWTKCVDSLVHKQVTSSLQLISVQPCRDFDASVDPNNPGCMFDASALDSHKQQGGDGLVAQVQTVLTLSVNDREPQVSSSDSPEEHQRNTPEISLAVYIDEGQTRCDTDIILDNVLDHLLSDCE